MIKDPEKVLSILLSVSEFSSNYANRLIKEGANVIFLIDPAASGNMISPKHFETFLMPAYRALRERIKEPIVLHICGDTNMVLSLIADTCFEAFSFEGPKVQVAKARKVIGNRMALGGNIPIDLMLLGNPKEIRQQVFNTLHEGVNIVMTSCGIPIHSPMENVKAMVKAVKDFNDNYGNR